MSTCAMNGQRVKLVGRNSGRSRPITGTVREYEPPPHAAIGECITIDRDDDGSGKINLPAVLYRYHGRRKWHVWGNPNGVKFYVLPAGTARSPAAPGGSA